MPLPDDYLRYDHRGYGMDHGLYPWSMLPARGKVAWPEGNKVALWTNIVLEHFPLDTSKTPFQPPLGLERPYPDYWNYTLRDYGNRVGCYRLFRMVDELGLQTSVSMNASLARSIPFLARFVAEHGYEVIAHGLDMAHLHAAGLDEATERGWIAESLSTLREATGQAVTGWLSPGQAQSSTTLKLLAEEGVKYCCDWSNDDMPYPFTGPATGMLSMPYPFDLSDYTCMSLWFQTAEEFAQQLLDKTRLLLDEAGNGGGRVMAVTLHAAISGQPYRIGAIREALAQIVEMPGVWSAHPGEIATAFQTRD
jgi:peptidoglycan/xylan/chitin deacetylase (PgdA/CDA1 family)